MAKKKKPRKETSWWLAKIQKKTNTKNAFCRYFSSLMCLVMPQRVIKFELMILCNLFIILSRHNCHLLISNGFELLRNVCYWKFLLIVFVVSFHHQASLSCGAKGYFSKLRYQLLLVQFSIIFHYWSLKCRTFLRMTQKSSDEDTKVPAFPMSVIFSRMVSL